MNPTNESNEAYERQRAAIIKSAAKLFNNWKDGDEFETNSDGKWYLTRLTDVVGNLLIGNEVRLKAPTPKKVLRPAWEIIKITPLYRNAMEEWRIGHQGMRTPQFALSNVIPFVGKLREEIKFGELMPDEWFTEETKR